MHISNFHFSPGYLFSYTLLALLIGVSILSTGCQKSEADVIQPVPEKQRTLVRATLIGEFSPDQIRKRYNNRPEANLLVNSGVKVYKLVYNTPDTEGNTVQASGALLVPVTDQPAATLSLQHGTITDDKAAPSNYNSSSEAHSFGTILASAGYIVSAPDYLGYGESRNIPHAYEHANSLASASLDMLRAAREFCEQNAVALTEQLFLAGYSEGGYATMALHKLIEEKHPDEFTVTASAPGAGAYHKSAFAQEILQSNQALPYINSYLWVLQTYNRVYDINQPFSYYLNEPYASRVASQGITADVSKNPQQLFTQTFRQDILNGTNKAMLAAFRDNDIYDWKPKAPVRLFHGTADNYVPFFNSQNAYEAMQKNGATQLELRRIEGGNHFSSVARYSIEALMFFADFQEELAESR